MENFRQNPIAETEVMFLKIISTVLTLNIISVVKGLHTFFKLFQDHISQFENYSEGKTTFFYVIPFRHFSLFFLGLGTRKIFRWKSTIIQNSG